MDHGARPSGGLELSPELEELLALTAHELHEPLPGYLQKPQGKGMGNYYDVDENEDEKAAASQKIYQGVTRGGKHGQYYQCGHM